MLDGTIHDRGSGPSDREEFQYDWWAPELGGPELGGPELGGPELGGPELGGPEWVRADTIVSRRTAPAKVIHSLVSMGSTAAIFTESTLLPPQR